MAIGTSNGHVLLYGSIASPYRLYPLPNSLVYSMVRFAIAGTIPR